MKNEKVFTREDAGRLLLEGDGRNVVIPYGYTAIDNGAFKHCDSLESIEIPTSVTTIGGGAFRNCTSLESVTIPASVTTIFPHAFYNCTSLKEITIPTSVTNIYNFTFRGCESLKNITFVEDSQVTAIGGCAFSGCTSLENIELPASVEVIGKQAFEYCTSLESVAFEAGAQLTSIAAHTFHNCTSLESINLPEGADIHVTAFAGCTELPPPGFVSQRKYEQLENKVYTAICYLEDAGLGQDDVCNILGLSQGEYNNIVNKRDIIFDEPAVEPQRKPPIAGVMADARARSEAKDTGRDVIHKDEYARD